MSHIVSVRHCQNHGKAELAFDVNNIELECDQCHRDWEGATAEIKARQMNFPRKIKYMQKHFPQRAEVLLLAVNRGWLYGKEKGSDSEEPNPSFT